MAASRLRAFCADRPPVDESKYYTRVPDDALEDPRLTDAQLKVFVNLLKNNWTGSRVIEITQAELAARARVTTRCVRDAMKRFELCGYLTMVRDRSKWGGPYRVELCYELRPALKLEDQPPVTSGSKASYRKRRSSVDRKPDSAVDRNGPSAPFLMFEIEKERETTETAIESSSSFSVSPTREELPPPAVPADLVETVKRLWPDEPLIERRLAAEVLHQGEAEGRLAIEYAELMGARGLVYAIRERARWWRDGYDLADCEALVQAHRPKPAAPVSATPERRPEIAAPPTPEEIRATLDQMAAETVPAVRRLYEGRIRGWIADGLIPPDCIPGAQKDGRGCSRQLPPRPSGVHPSEPPSRPESEHTVKVCSRQEATQSPTSGQRARLDSNQQPSDSKDASSTPVEPPSSPAILAPTAPPDHPDSGKTPGLYIRGFKPS